MRAPPSLSFLSVAALAFLGACGGAPRRGETTRASDDDRDLRQATPDPTPPAVEPSVEADDELTVREQAGVGGPLPYGAEGVFEYRGGGLFSGDADGFLTSQRLGAGLFVLDGFQLGLHNELVAAVDSQGLRVAFVGMIDGDVYLPIATRFWLQVGLGVGGLYNGTEGAATGAARLGPAMLIGRSAVLHLLAEGALASAPFVQPYRPDAGTSQWRVGGVIELGAMF